MTDPATDLLLVRHGQAVCNVTGVVGGPRSCTGLTPLGREQARQLAARLNGGEPVTVMYTAPRLRVQETAQIIGRDIRLVPALDPLLDGPDHGDADGRPWAEVKTAFGGPPQSSPDRPVTAGAETWNRYLARAADLCITIHILPGSGATPDYLPVERRRDSCYPKNFSGLEEPRVEASAPPGRQHRRRDTGQPERYAARHRPAKRPASS
jgi:hypothetical protein